MIEQSRKIQEMHEKQMSKNRCKKLTPRQIEILELISEFPDIDNKNLTLLLGIARTTLKGHTTSLELRGLIKYKLDFQGAKKFRVNKTVMNKFMLINKKSF